MADNIWRGGAAAAAQVCTATPANVEIGDIFTLIITDDLGNTASAAFTATAATVANVTAGLTAAWNASLHPFLTAITAVDNTTTITLTADTAGVPFALTATAVNGGAADTQTLTIATTTASTGPYDAGVAQNWSLGAVPVNTNNVYFPAGAPSCLYRLNLSAVTAAVIESEAGYSGSIGRLANGFLYSLRLGCTAMTVRGSGALMAFDIGASAIAPLVQHVGTGSYAGLSCVNIIGTAITTGHVESGDVGVANYPGQIATATAGFTLAAGTLRVGPGVTVAGCTLTATGGSVYAECSIPTVKAWDCTFRQEAGTFTTGSFYGSAVCYPNAGGTYATVNVYGAATVDKTESLVPSTFTNTNLYRTGVAILDPASKLTFTNPPVYQAGMAT